MTINKIPYILVAILVGALIWVYFDKPNGHTQQMERLLIENQRLRIGMDSSAKSAEEWRKTALEYGNQYRNEATRAMKSEEKLNYALEENRILKRRVIRYSNAWLDSLLRARYGR